MNATHDNRDKVLRSHPSRRGSIIVSALVIVLVLMSMSGALLTFNTASRSEVGRARDSGRALLMAEAGIHDCMARLAGSVEFEDDTLKPTKGLGTAALPMTMGTGSYWVDYVETDETVTLTAYGLSGAERRAVEVVLTQPTSGVYGRAIFSGNSSDDPTYSLDLGGVGGQADSIDGDVFSGGDVTITGDAEVTGDIAATGSIVGGAGEEGVTQPAPDLDAMNYEVNNDFDVAQEFSTGGASYRRDSAGGRAWQLPEENPAHIFRLNPSDRRSENNSTSKDDYYLEDPYERVQSDPNQNGKNAYKITLSGTMGRPGPPGTDSVYYIDGNLWIHNKRSYSLKLYNAGNEASRVTFVVKGNIYFSDNLFYKNKNKDGVAFIAMSDDAVEDSGNIYFGDPAFGTLKHMDAFMYAENNFYDNNLDANGTSIRGNMSAGNQLVRIDWGDDDDHSKLDIDFDDRIELGALDLPGIPLQGAGTGFYTVLSWREVSATP